tara:strand:+ start:694 stop:1842 length:1149 start_codon:yes stop_codon:yes gene_type:complete
MMYRHSHHQYEVVVGVLMACLLGGSWAGMVFAQADTDHIAMVAGAETEPGAAVSTSTPLSVVAASSRLVLVDAMIGQVNGEPIYAKMIFKAIEEELVALAQQVSRVEFGTKAYRVIRRNLESVIAKRLLLDEARRELSGKQQLALPDFLAELREQTIRQFGRGVEILADEALRAQGSSLDERMEEKREEVLVGIYLQQKIRPQVSVSRRDIRNYYQDHHDQFNPPPGRIVRLIRVSDRKHAEQIEQMLVGGIAFEKVAAHRFNESNRGRGGLWSDAPLAGDHPFRYHELNDAMTQLNAGEYSSRLAIGDSFFWVHVESQSAGISRPLHEVQLEIHQVLSQEQFKRLTDQFQQELYRNGSYDDKAVMIEKLLEIALNRYAPAS